MNIRSLKPVLVLACFACCLAAGALAFGGKGNPDELASINELIKLQAYPGARQKLDSYTASYSTDYRGFSLLADVNRIENRIDDEQAALLTAFDLALKEEKIPVDWLEKTDARLNALMPYRAEMGALAVDYAKKSESIAEQKMRAGFYSYAEQIVREALIIAPARRNLYDMLGEIEDAAEASTFTGIALFNHKNLSGGWKVTEGNWSVEERKILGAEDPSADKTAELLFDKDVALPATFSVQIGIPAGQEETPDAVLRFYNSANRQEGVEITFSKSGFEVRDMRRPWGGGPGGGGPPGPGGWGNSRIASGNLNNSFTSSEFVRLDITIMEEGKVKVVSGDSVAEGSSQYSPKKILFAVQNRNQHGLLVRNVFLQK